MIRVGRCIYDKQGKITYPVKKNTVCVFFEPVRKERFALFSNRNLTDLPLFQLL